MNELSPAQATLIAACISAVVTLVVCAINSRNQSKRFTEELRARDVERDKAAAVRAATLKMWMEEVDKKLDTHNGYAEQFYQIRKDIAVIKNDIKTLYRKEN